MWLVQQVTTTLSTGESSQEDRYLLTSLAPGTLTGQQALAVVRGHWRIENCSNLLVMDTVLEEDDYPWVARGDGLLVSSLIRLMAFNLLQLLRNRTLRSEAGRTLSWRQVGERVHETVILALAGALLPGRVALTEVLFGPH